MPEIVDIPLEKIRRPKAPDRIEIDPEGIQELAKNISEQGLLQNPIVRPVGDDYEIVAGDRRILAIRQLAWESVPCVVKKLDDTQTAIVRASENLARRDLSPIEEAKIYKRLQEQFGLSYDQIGRKMGISGGLVKRRLDLLKMPPQLQDAVHKKKISYGVAEALWTISDETMLDYYLGFAIEHGVTVAVARQWANDWKMSQIMKPTIEEGQEDTISPMASRPVWIACDLCQGPMELGTETVLRICPDCRKMINKRLFGGE